MIYKIDIRNKNNSRSIRSHLVAMENNEMTSNCIRSVCNTASVTLTPKQTHEIYAGLVMGSNIEFLISEALKGSCCTFSRVDERILRNAVRGVPANIICCDECYSLILPLLTVHS